MGRMVNYPREAGATMVEYGFLLASIAIVVAIVAVLFGDAVTALYASAMAWF